MLKDEATEIVFYFKQILMRSLKLHKKAQVLPEYLIVLIEQMQIEY